MGTASPQRNFSDYLDLLRAFNQRDAQALIVGGQAVNFWAEVFQEEEPELRQYRPFTSSDLDLHRPNVSVRGLLCAQAGRIEPERDPFGKAFTIVSQTFLIQGADGGVLPVDELKMVAGLHADEVKKGGVLVEFAGVTIHVLNPICCLKAKFFNVRTLAQRNRQDLKHVKILVICVRAFVRRLLAEASASGNHRPLLNALRQVLLYTSHTTVVQTARSHGIDLTRTLPLPELVANDQPKIARFTSYQLPKWRRLHGHSI